MITFVIVLFVILCLFLGIFILIQPGKGEMGFGGLGQSGQALFGGSGGQDFFEKATWIMGSLFMVGALGISLLRMTVSETRLKEYKTPVSLEKKELPQKPDVTKTKETASSQ